MVRGASFYHCECCTNSPVHTECVELQLRAMPLHTSSISSNMISSCSGSFFLHPNINSTSTRSSITSGKGSRNQIHPLPRYVCALTATCTHSQGQVFPLQLLNFHSVILWQLRIMSKIITCPKLKHI